MLAALFLLLASLFSASLFIAADFFLPVSTRSRCILLLSSVFYSLILYTNRSDPKFLVLNPSSDELCLAQASLINGVQAMTAVSSFSLIANLWLTFNRPNLYCTSRPKKIIKGILVLISYIAFFVFFLAAFILGSKPAVVIPLIGDAPVVVAPNLAVPTPLYCVIVENGDVTNNVNGVFRILLSAYIFSAIMYGITFLIEAQILWTILTKRSTMSSERVAYRETFIRVAIFSVYRVFSLLMLGFVIRRPSEIFLEGVSSTLTVFDGLSEIIQAGVPLVAFLVLGTRKDILVTWGLRGGKARMKDKTGRSREFVTARLTLSKPGSDTPSELEKGSVTGLPSIRTVNLDTNEDHYDNIEIGSAHTASEFAHRSRRELSPVAPEPALQKKDNNNLMFWKAGK